MNPSALSVRHAGIPRKRGSFVRTKEGKKTSRVFLSHLRLITRTRTHGVFVRRGCANPRTWDLKRNRRHSHSADEAKRQSAGRRSRASAHLFVFTFFTSLAVVPLSFVVQWPTGLSLGRQSRGPWWHSGDSCRVERGPHSRAAALSFFFFFSSPGVSRDAVTRCSLALVACKRSHAATHRPLCAERFSTENASTLHVKGLSFFCTV